MEVGEDGMGREFISEPHKCMRRDSSRLLPLRIPGGDTAEATHPGEYCDEVVVVKVRGWTGCASRRERLVPLAGRSEEEANEWISSAPASGRGMDSECTSCKKERA